MSRKRASIDGANKLVDMSAKTRKVETAENLKRHEAAEALLLLSEQPPPIVDDDVIEGAMILMAFSNREPQKAPEEIKTFEEYRQKALEDLRAKQGGELVKSNPKMRRNVRGSNAPDATDPAKYEMYQAIRKKNNAAAQKSRDGHKLKEIETEIKFNYYEMDNKRCVAELANTRDEIKIVKLQVKLSKEHLMSHNDDFDEVAVGPMHWLSN